MTTMQNQNKPQSNLMKRNYRQFIEEQIKVQLLNQKRESKAWIIQQMLKIEEEDLINVHRYFTTPVVEELKRLSRDHKSSELQRIAITLFSVIIQVEINNMQYLTKSGLIQNYLQLLASSDKQVFTSLIIGLQVFFDCPNSLNQLVELKIIEIVMKSIQKSQCETISLEGFNFIGKCFQFTTKDLSFLDTQNIFETYMRIALNGSDDVKTGLNESLLKFCKYLFKHGLHSIFSEKGNIVYLLELFQGYPKLIRLVFKKLSNFPIVIKKIVQQEANYLLALITEVIPTAKLTLTLALVQILRIVLEDEAKYITTLWERQDIMEELKGNLSIEKDLTLNILQIYRLLIAHKDYDRISEKIVSYDIVGNIIQAIAVQRDEEAIQKGLFVIYSIFEFETSRLKTGEIKQAVFTQEMRSRNQTGYLIEELTKKNCHHSVKILGSKILSGNFVKIRGKVMSIDVVCKKKL